MTTTTRLALYDDEPCDECKRIFGPHQIVYEVTKPLPKSRHNGLFVYCHDCADLAGAFPF